jgi:dephospho-CoA kinase
MTRNSLTEEAARRWIAAQLPSAEKAARADFVISTDGSVEQTDEQVQNLIRRIREE